MPHCAASFTSVSPRPLVSLLVPDALLTQQCVLQVTDKDAAILEHLQDITEEAHKGEDGEDAGFRLTFKFAAQEFFTNSELVSPDPLSHCAQSGMADVFLHTAVQSSLLFDHTQPHADSMHNGDPLQCGHCC